MSKQCCFTKTKLDIKKYQYWTVAINENQSYLGRCIIYLNKHKEDFFDIEDKELKELMKIGENLRDALKKIFKPDKFNYTSLGNEIPHLHLHIIPRYKKQVTFNSKKYQDKRWGKNYSPFPKLKLPQDELQNIKNLIAKELNVK